MFQYTDTTASPWWVVDANDKAAELHGYDRKEFLELSVEDYVADVARDEVQGPARHEIAVLRHRAYP